MSMLVPHHAFTVIVVALLVVQSAAFSQSRCPVRSTITSVSSGTKKTTLFAKNYRSTAAYSPGADFFSNGSSYVPSGLTKEQYEKIKREEQKELNKKDFASWGPRFDKSERPDGDWMVVPSLWTDGFSSGKNRGAKPMSPGSGNENEKTKSIPILASIQLKKVLPIYALASFMLEILFSATYLFHKKAAVSYLIIAMTKMKRANDILLLSSSLLAKITASKLMLATLLVKPLGLMIEKCNRKFLWSPRRSMFYSMIASLGSLTIWTGLVMGCKTLLM